MWIAAKHASNRAQMRRLVIYAMLGFVSIAMGQQPAGAPPMEQVPVVRHAPIAEPIRPAAQLAAPVKLYSPADAVRFAARDILTVPLALRPSMRYLSAYNAAPEDRPKLWQSLSFLCNSLSRERTITRPAIVAGTDNTLFRVCLDDYQWPAAAWERLAEKGSGPAAAPEPYFHTAIDRLVEVEETYQADELVPYGVEENGKWRKVEDRRESVTRKRKVQRREKSSFASAPWLPLPETTSLLSTTESAAPIVRADWFLANASLPPAYYEFLGIDPKKGTEADLQTLALADIKLVSRAKLEQKGVVVKSQVALHNRTLKRFPTVAGYYWESRDSLKSVDDRDYLQQVLDEKADAKEIIFSLPNLLQGYGVVNAAGIVQDKADPDIAQDYSTPLQDKQVRTGRNCMTCHASGMQPIGDEVRSLSRDKIALLTADPANARRVRDFFSTDLAKQTERDGAAYAEAVAACNGLKAEVNAGQVEKQIHGYTDATLDADGVSMEVGVSADRVLSIIKRGVGIDARLTGLLQTPPRKIRRDQWERAAFGQLMLLIGQVKQ
jgi:hypothetical protein